MKREVSIYTIAKEAKVSPATVSRVLSGGANVSEEKKRLVNDIMQKYDYRPNALARGLTKSKTETIGIIVADCENPYYAKTISVCEEECDKRGYLALIASTRSRFDLEPLYLKRMIDMRVDAVILLGGLTDSREISAEYLDLVGTIASKIPVVSTGRLDGVKAFRVSLNEIKAAEVVMSHLLEMGHRKIAFIGGDAGERSTYDKRVRYRTMLRENGIDYRDDYVVDSTYDIDGGYKAVNALLDRLEPSDYPTAIIAINDFSAVGAMSAIKEHNLRIPEEVAVVGFDNTYMAKALSITSVDYDYQTFGEKLTGTAIRAMEEDTDTIPPEQLISVRLKKRTSSTGSEYHTKK